MRRDTRSAARWRAFSTAGGVFLLDRFSKWVVEARLPPGETHTLIPGLFNLIRTENRGAAFSLLAGWEGAWPTGLLIALSAAAVVLISVLLWRSATAPDSSPLLRRGLGLILGGAAGNLVDRVFRGAVTDFLELYAGRFHWPVFNVADAAITCGALLVLWDMWRARRAERRS